MTTNKFLREDMYPKAKPLSSNGLSLLAKGKGLLNGGVEIECHSQTGYSLSGQSFTKPSLSRKGQHATMVKPCILNLPKTFVTRRGALVLFTSPEDMIIGQSCQVHEHTRAQNVSLLSKQAAQELKTTSNLAISALSYDTEKDSGISEGERDNTVPPKPGNFTNVYLQSLDKLKANKKSIDSQQQLFNEKSEGVPEMLLPVDSDSGFDSCSHPTTSGRLSSALSYHSDLPTHTATIVSANQSEEYTDERETQVHFDENVDIVDNNSITLEEPTDSKDKTKELFVSLLLSKQKSSVKPSAVKNTKKRVPANKKLTPNDQRSTKITATAKTTDPSIPDSNETTTKKPVRKRTKKQRKNKDISDFTSNSSNNSQVTLGAKIEADNEETILSSKIQIDDISDLPQELPKQTAVTDTCRSNQESNLQSERAQRRMLEAQRKKQEKRALELQKKQLLAENTELVQQVLSYQGELDDKENMEEQSILSLTEETIAEMSTQGNTNDDVKVEEETTYVHQPVVTKRDSSVISALSKRTKEMKEKALQEDMKRIEAEQERRRLEEERLKKAQKGLERIEQTIREQNMAEKRDSEKERLTYQKRLELETQKCQERRTVNYFSYFSYLPTKQSKDKRKKPRTAMPKRNKS